MNQLKTSNRTFLGLAIAALLGTSGAAFAQSASGSAEAKVRTDVTAEAAVEDAQAAREDANRAMNAAQTAAQVRAAGATTAEGAAQAEYSAHQADQASVQAQAAANAAINAANEANAAKGAAHSGTALPEEATMRAQQAATKAAVASEIADAAASDATMAAHDTVDASVAPPAEPMPAPAVAGTLPVAVPVVTVKSVPNDPIASNFAATDVNNDGAIDRSEAAVDAQLNAQFGKFDSDADGRLAIAEYKVWRDRK